jgi:transcriptional regulator with XRE-family HTH domain
MQQESPTDGKSIAARLRAARIAAKMTQQELAGEHFSKSYISAVERGKMTPSVPALDYLAGQLQVPMSYFVGETELDLSTSPAPSPHEQAQAKKEAAAQLLLDEAEQAAPATAVVLLRAAAYLSPRIRPLACAHLASVSLAQGALEEAEALIEEGRAAARALGDALAEGHVVLVLAQLKERQGDSAGAEQAYRDAVTLLEGDPAQVEARERYSQWLAAAGRFEEAVHLLQATARHRPSS